ncbi:hypothetical protein SCP_1103440 [Sparassis crispa]|uniref:RING-type domain-containing protein n=1 Tax=Sparassis crispa TaxID=139825 RepID=A0A401GZS3_9APHY|nr:hypothetical protein SCP_1103440 [Sparassis crispa]GBE87667.1 hypothetical protein SCP_1103440 [Sparassis crispa]
MTRHSLIPASAPTSPAVTRSKSDRHPVTPQRVVHPQLRQFNSPYTPAPSLSTVSTPYTPLSLRSFSSSNASSLATPASAISRRRMSLSLSPEINLNHKSLADIAENWRTRANENGIKVTSSDDSQYEADSSSLSDVNNSLIDKSLLPAPFFSTQRRERAYSQAQAPLSQIPDPTQFCTPNRVLRPPGILNTPPSQPSFRLRGSLTDPAHTRRRPPFDQTSELFNIDEDEYAPYPPTFSSSVSTQAIPLALTDPFGLHASIPANVEPIQFYETRKPPQESATDVVSACSVCGLSGKSLAILEPCAHPLCSACLTSALNIVGEKDMECAVCKAKVDDFKLCRSTSGKSTVAKTLESDAYIDHDDFARGMDAFAGASEVDMVVDTPAFCGFDDFMDRAQGASTPVAGRREIKSEEPVVLRIDNVPWDITPPAIAAWLNQPVVRVHVLLDRKGKTMSHAYAEMANAEVAQAALRTAQNSVLGKGKRARGVTVTRSSQEELMQALFPAWQGNFDGSRPSLSGLDNERVISTLQRGLFSEGELNALLHLIRSPDSHFLKVPSLPFHSLTSILSKFPSDDDSRVFWSSTLRDTLYEITYAAVQVLLVRIEENPLSDWTTLMGELVRAAMDCQAFTSDQMSKLSDILEASLPQSMSSPPGMHTALHTPSSPQSVAPQSHEGYNSPDLNTDRRTYNDLAKEFGVEADLIHALAQRLSGLC